MGAVLKKVTVVAVGKVKESFIRDGIREYEKRLSRFCEFSVRECEESKREDTSEESKSLLKETAGGYNILTDRSGEVVSSERLAEILGEALVSKDRVNFIIGGSRGVTDEVKRSADKVVSFGKATFPHMLFRLLLTEQIYRAFTINANLPYHK